MNAPASPVPAVTHSALAALGDARAAIERVTTVDDAKGIRDRAEALRVYPTRGVVIPMGEFLQRLAQVPTVEAAA